MEKKTIGSFIATLRKASGLTQKQLAEMLLVTDKTVSRWERDETLPDLTLIPVIAEIFGVTSDELLRGERKAPSIITSPICRSGDRDSGETADQGAESDAETKVSTSAVLRSEKQFRRILSGTKTAHQTRCMVSVVISVIGLILTVTCMVAILIKDVDECAIGCALGLIANLAAAVYQRVGTINAMAAIDCEEFAGEPVSEIKAEIIRSEASVMKTVVVVSSVVLWLARIDVDAGAWIFPMIAVFVCWIISDSAKKRIKELKQN